MKLQKFSYLLLFLVAAVFKLIFPTSLYAQTTLFEDNFETDTNQWNIVRGTWVKNYINGSNRFGLSLNTPSSTAEAQGGDYSWTNYEFSFDMLPIRGIDRNIFFRVTTQRSGSFWNMDVPSSYGLHMYSNKLWLQKWNPNSQTEPVSIPISLPDNTVTHFKILVIDNTIKVYLNDGLLPVIDYLDDNNPILSGRIALSVTTGSTYPTEVWFDNVKVTSIDPPLPQLKVIKELKQDNGGNDNIGDFILKVGDTVVTSGETNNFDPGTYTVSETGPAGYTTTYSEDCDSSGQVILQTGDSLKTCVITNDDIAPKVTVTKSITNNTEGTDPNAFGISVGGNPVNSGSTTEVEANKAFSINETGMANYDFVSITGAGCPAQLGEEITLSLGQNINCTITNNYVPPPTPITKVFVIPGLGASWNVDSLINCRDSGGKWTLAPYAEGIYNNLLDNLNDKGWSAIPFYYDWRKDIRESSSILNGSINSNTSGDEKVNLVGHSMGGLIGRNYLENQSGGKASKFLAVGTPNQGSALAYPALVNNEVWTNDLVQKIAATLFFNHCGVPPSFKNLLPTYDYLKDARTGQLKSVSQMKNKNNYLPTDFVSNFWGVEVGTLAGTGQDTLKVINVIRDFRWPDGKPVGRETTGNGDGTVLVDSAQISNASYNETINQSHSGIVASDEGVGKILEFLGSPGADKTFKLLNSSKTSDPGYTEHKSALILVGYPGEFSITDKDGHVTESIDGMIAIMDPNDGDYQLQISPTSNVTTFMVGQFLSNGKSEYNEYKIRGLNQEPKVIEFNSKYPNKNPMHEIRQYKYPHFPRFWFNFWSFWNRFRRW